MVNIEKKEEEKREHLIHIAFSEIEKNEIDEFQEKLGFSTRTAFIRECIRDKIRRDKNPDIFAPKIDFDNEILERLLKNSEISIENQKEIKELLPILTNIKHYLKQIDTLVNRDELKEKEAKVIEILKKYEILTPKELVEKTGFVIDDIYDVISNADVFTTETGGIRLK